MWIGREGITYGRVTKVALGDGLEERRLADVCQSNLGSECSVSGVGETEPDQVNPQCRS